MSAPPPKSLWRRLADWFVEPVTPECPRCKRPIAAWVNDRAVWDRHHALSELDDHAFPACDGSESCGTVTVECRYDGYSGRGDGDW